MKFPAFGRALWERRLLGERPRVVALLVGNVWQMPPSVARAGVPRLAVKTGPWHIGTGPRFDWRLVADCSVLAYDVRGPDEREEGPDGWDPWLWLLADVLHFARDVQRFTPTEEFYDPPGAFAAERSLELFAWLNSAYIDTDPGPALRWPPWWPYGDTRAPAAVALASP